jgi:hypothetical protein
LSTLISNYEFRLLPVEIFIDGPKNIGDEEEQYKILTTIDLFNVFGNIRTHRRRENLGLANSVIAGLDEVFSENDSAIVIEDDLELSPFFLSYCLQGLNTYKNDLQVASIHGHLPELDVKIESPFFLRGADCWGWATWKDRWADFESNENLLLSQLEEKKLSFDFNLDNNYPYFEMLQRQSRGEIDSWAIRWHASMYLQNKFTLYPNVSFVRNSGQDGSGTHYKLKKSKSNVSIEDIANRPITLVRQNIAIDYEVRESLKRYMYQKNKSSKGFMLHIKHILSEIVAKLTRENRKNL